MEIADEVRRANLVIKNPFMFYYANCLKTTASRIFYQTTVLCTALGVLMQYMKQSFKPGVGK